MLDSLITMRQAVLPAGATRVISSQTGAEYESGAQLRNTPYNPDVEVTDSRENSETAPRRSTGLAAQEPHTGGNKTRKAATSVPERKGPVWNTVKVIGDEMSLTPKVQCLNCPKIFSGGVSRIKDHITGVGVIIACPRTPLVGSQVP